MKHTHVKIKNTKGIISEICLMEVLVPIDSYVLCVCIFSHNYMNRQITNGK